MEEIDYKSRIGNLVQNKILRYESLVLLFILGAIFLKIAKVPNAGLLMTIVLVSVSMIYFFSAFALTDFSGEIEFTAYDLFIKKLMALASSVSLIGILFTFQNWPYGEIMIIVGLLNFIIGLGYILIQGNKSQGKFDKFLIIRIIILIAISAVILFFNLNDLSAEELGNSTINHL
jgi:hypothetical protein